MAMYSDKSVVAAVLENVKLRFADGDTYDGQAWNSVRHGRGMYRWRNGEVFDGYFYYDLMHGAGQYCWPDGRFFSGHFYANRRHGYGLLAFPNGDTVQGLFRDGVLYGPAVQSSKMEQDVGWWLGCHLLQVLMEQHFDVPYLQQVLTLLPPKPGQEGKSSPQLEAGEGGGSGEGAVAVRRYQLNGAAVGQPHQAFVALLDMAFEQSRQRTAWQYQQVFRNNSPQLRAMQHYVWQMDWSMQQVSRQVEEAFVGGREGKFLPAGPKERQVEQLFRACATGDLRMVQQLILRDKLNVDVCDRNGISPLMTATVNCRLGVMEFLLEFEADMEHETNSGYSVVELAFVMYHCFVEKFNGWNNNDPSVESVLGLPEKVTVTPAASAIDGTTGTLVSTKSSPPKSAPAQAAPTKTTPGEFRLDQVEQNVKGVMDTYHSVQALKDVPINLPPHAFQRTGQQLYHLVSRYGLSMEKPRAENTFFLSWLKHWQHSLKEALLLLLKRGANWRRCIWPQPLLFSAVRGLDADLLRKLVDMGDDVNQRMFKEGFAVTPLLVACGMMGSAAVEVVEVLLKAGADADAPEINTNPTKVQADKKGAKRKKGSPVPTSSPLDQGRRPIHVVFQRDGADPANEKLLEALIRYDATVEATWNNSSALASAVQLANVTMVGALLRVGCDVNRDLEGGKGNALCVLATLATTEGFLRCNKDAQTIKAVMKMLLASADFTIKIPLAEGPPGSPLDFASHLFAKQALGANLQAQLKETLADLRTSITEAYKEATQLSVLRHRKLTLAGTISPELQSLLRKYPQLIDGPDPSLKLKKEERVLLGAVKDIREKIGSLMEEDVSKEGQRLRPTLKIANEEAVRTGVIANGSAKQVKNNSDMSALAAQVQRHLQVGGSSRQGADVAVQRTAQDRRAVSSKKQAAAAKAAQAMKHLSFAAWQAFLPSQKEEWCFSQDVDSEGNIMAGASLVMGYSHGQVEVEEAGTLGQVTVLTDYQQGRKQGAFRGLKSGHVQHMVKATALLHPQGGPAAGKGKLRRSVIVHQSVYGTEGQGWQLKDAPSSSQQLDKHGRHHHRVPRHDDPDHPNLLVPAVHLLDDEGDALPLDDAVMEYRYCSQCGRSTGVGLFPCPRCNALFYDSKECQEAHWPLHRKRCAQIAQRKEHNEKVRKIVLEEKAQRRQKGRPLNALGNAAPPAAGPVARGHKRPLPPHAPSRKGQGPSSAGARGGLVEGSSSRLRAAPPSAMHRQATVKKARRPLVAAAAAAAPPQHLRSIDTAGHKSQAQWMERVRQLNRLRMDDEMASFINDHYKWLVERGLNLAIARDVVEVKNGELHATMAFRRQIPLTELIRYQQETHQQLPEVTDTRLAHKEGLSSTMPLSPVTITSFPTTSTQHPAHSSAGAAASLSPAKDLTTFFTYQDSKEATFAFP